MCDGGNALGQVTSHQAVNLVVERARQFGLAAVAVRNAFHFGMAGRYARRIAEAGAIGMVMSNTRPLMPAPGGAEAMVGNNPIAIAVPSQGEYPVEVDMALSETEKFDWRKPPGSLFRRVGLWIAAVARPPTRRLP